MFVIWEVENIVHHLVFNFSSIYFLEYKLLKVVAGMNGEVIADTLV